MLVLDDVSAGYGPVVALHGISLEVSPGELVALIGVNGAGKTTTLNTIAGIIKPLRGQITWQGDRIAGRTPEDIVRRGISLVPERRRIFAGLTVGENLRLGAATRRDRAGIQRDIAGLCERFPILGQRFNQLGGTLSGGEQQQLAIARALLARPKLLMLDEPSLGLAPLLVEQVFQLIAQLHGDGVTILLVEQNVERTLEVADRVYLLNTGRIEYADTAAELQRHVDITGAYLGGSPDRRAEGTTP